MDDKVKELLDRIRDTASAAARHRGGHRPGWPDGRPARW